MATAKAPCYQLALSAESREDLHQKINALQRFLTRHPHIPIEDIIFSVNLLHKKQDYRATFYATNHLELLSALQDYQNHYTPFPTWQEPRIAFIFTGQGVQYPGMMAQLYKTETTFKSTIDNCTEILQPRLSISLPNLLFNSSEKRLAEVQYNHPALFSVELALALTLRHYGIRPHAMIGHSIGEYVAAVLSGSLSVSDALRIIHLRSQLLCKLPQNGGMLAVKRGEKATKKLITTYHKLNPSITIEIASVNSTTQTIVAGILTELRCFSTWLHRQNIANIFLSVSHAFHSSFMNPIVEEFEKLILSIKHHAPKITIINNLTGKPFSARQLSGHYWARQLRHTLRFYDGLKWLDINGTDIFLEVSPHPTLISAARSSFVNSRARWLATLRRDHNGWAREWDHLLASLTELYLNGADVNWAVFARTNGNVRHLYPVINP